jgi:hypothetical protein
MRAALRAAAHCLSLISAVVVCMSGVVEEEVVVVVVVMHIPACASAVVRASSSPL